MNAICNIAEICIRKSPHKLLISSIVNTKEQFITNNIILNGLKAQRLNIDKYVKHNQMKVTRAMAIRETKDT